MSTRDLEVGRICNPSNGGTDCKSVLLPVPLRLNVLQHLAPRDEALAAYFLDVQRLKQPPPQLALGLLDRAGGRARQRDVAAGAAVMAARPAHLADDLPQQLTRAAA